MRYKDIENDPHYIVEDNWNSRIGYLSQLNSQVIYWFAQADKIHRECDIFPLEVFDDADLKDVVNDGIKDNIWKLQGDNTLVGLNTLHANIRAWTQKERERLFNIDYCGSEDIELLDI